MTTEMKQRAEKLCEEALDLEPAERKAFLDRKCDGQAELRKTCKIRAGQVVGLTGTRIRVLSPNSPTPVVQGQKR